MLTEIFMSGAVHLGQASDRLLVHKALLAHKVLLDLQEQQAQLAQLVLQETSQLLHQLLQQEKMEKLGLMQTPEKFMSTMTISG
jgi:hypothetical protein